jgi:hypothetical protein
LKSAFPVLRGFTIISVLFLVACSAPQDSKILKNISPTSMSTIAATVTPSPAAPPIEPEDPLQDIPKPSFQSTPVKTNASQSTQMGEIINLPTWVSDPNINILLYGTGAHRDNIDNLFLVNASTFEIFTFPTINEIFAYFWTPEGEEIGIVTKDWQLILVNIVSGKVSRIPEEEKLIWHEFGFEGSQITLNAPGNPDKLILFPGWISDPGALSYDGQFTAERNLDHTLTSIVNLETNNEILLNFSQEQPYFLSDFAWSPANAYLAEITVDQDGCCGSYFDTPDYTLRIFDINGQVVSKIKNVTSTNWSPDGTKFLYSPLNHKSQSLWRSPPCIYDLMSDQTKCFNDLANKSRTSDDFPQFAKLNWLPGQTEFAYIYFSYDHDIELWERGICFVNISSSQERCILTDLDEPGLGIVNFKLSPDASSLYFFTNDTGPISDDMGLLRMGIANIETSEYEMLTEVGESAIIFPPSALWRP